MKINFGKKFERLDEFLEIYESDYEDALKEQDIKGRPIGEVCAQNHMHLGYYAERLSELKHALAHMEMRVEEVKGKLYQGIKKSSNISLTTTEINGYIKSDPDYVKVYVRMLEVKEMVDKYSATVDTFRNIGYALNNLTQLTVNQLRDQEL